jgi:hypothetical protein
MKKSILILCLLTFTVSVKAQELLNKKKKDIINFIVKNNGEIRRDIKSKIDMADYKLADQLIASPANENIKGAGFPMWFFFRNNKCYKYTLFYEGENERKKFIDKLIMNRNLENQKKVWYGLIKVTVMIFQY